MTAFGLPFVGVLAPLISIVWSTLGKVPATAFESAIGTRNFWPATPVAADPASVGAFPTSLFTALLSHPGYFTAAGLGLLVAVRAGLWWRTTRSDGVPNERPSVWLTGRGFYVACALFFLASTVAYPFLAAPRHLNDLATRLEAPSAFESGRWWEGIEMREFTRLYSQVHGVATHAVRQPMAAGDVTFPFARPLPDADDFAAVRGYYAALATATLTLLFLLVALGLFATGTNNLRKWAPRKPSAARVVLVFILVGAFHVMEWGHLAAAHGALVPVSVAPPPTPRRAPQSIDRRSSRYARRSRPPRLEPQPPLCS